VRFGHEWSGIVEAVGEDVKNFKVGDRIFSDSGISCGECEDCKAGNYGDCKHIRSVGTINAWEGPFAEYMLVPEYNAYKISDNVSYDEAALIEPTAISYDAFSDFEVKPDMTVAVIGVGAIGMGAIWLAKYFGAKNVIAVGLRNTKLEIAGKIGADTLVNSRECDAAEAVLGATGGQGADLVIETSGQQSALVQAIKMTKSEGRISIVSFYEKDVTLPVDDIVVRKITVKGAAGQFGNPEKVCKIMSEYETKLTPVITHRLPFDGCLDYFENEEKYHNEKIKVMVEFE
jgi:L-iditol 2-dehydrogenase